MWRSVCFLLALVLVIGCNRTGGITPQSTSKPKAPDPVKLAKTLEKVSAYRSGMKFAKPYVNARIFARLDVPYDVLAKLGCQGLGSFHGITPKVRTRVSEPVVVKCGAGMINREEIIDPQYPRVGKTYLSFFPPNLSSGFPPKVLSFFRGHGFQVNYFDADGVAWLWYPGNRRGLREDWKTSGDDVCFRHPKNSYNPVTRRSGGNFDCMGRKLASTRIIAVLDGDPFDLVSGKVPYRLDRCKAPDAFDFDRKELKC